MRAADSCSRSVSPKIALLKIHEWENLEGLSTGMIVLVEMFL
jgi:hypothetical protein